jgi:S-adenosylmethionine:tRNA ribosyltransferase-isomerase
VPLALWDTWTSIASTPAAFEPPSAGFLLSWELLGTLRARGIRFAALTHAAGISSTGDPALDPHLPFDEPYVIPARTASLVEATRRDGSRVVALGTTVVRALEGAATEDGRVRSGVGLATGRIDRRSCLQVVDAIVSGTHEPGTSHHDLLSAFADDDTLAAVDAALDRQHYRTHEFGDSVLIEASAVRRASGGQLPGCSRMTIPGAAPNTGIVVPRPVGF